MAGHVNARGFEAGTAHEAQLGVDGQFEHGVASVDLLVAVEIARKLGGVLDVGAEAVLTAIAADESDLVGGKKGVGLAVVIDVVLVKFVAPLAERALFVQRQEARFEVAVDTMPLLERHGQVELEFAVVFVEIAEVAGRQGIDRRRD